MRINYVPKWILCLPPAHYLMKEILAFAGLKHTHSTHIRMIKFGATVHKEAGSFRNIYVWNGYKCTFDTVCFIDEGNKVLRFEIITDEKDLDYKSLEIITTPFGFMKLACEFKKKKRKARK